MTNNFTYFENYKNEKDHKNVIAELDRILN